MEPVEFRIVDGGDRQSFEEEVNQLLGDGWTLHGSPSVVVTAQTAHSGPGYPVGMFYYSQALTKPREKGSSVYEQRGARSIS